MKIGINTLFLIPGEVGGSETYLRQTLKAMIPGNPSDEFVLFTNIENESVLKDDLAGCANVSFENLNFRATRRFVRIIAEQTKLPLLVKKNKVDVLWSPGYTAPIFCKCRQVVTIHDMQYKTHREDLSLFAWLATDILVRLAARRCDGIIAVSEFSKSEIVKYTSARPDKVTAVYEAVDSAFGVLVDSKSRDSLIRNLLGGNEPYILSVANSYPHKNLHRLVESFAEVMDKIDHRLVIVGKPRRGERKLQSAIARLDDKSRVKRIDGVNGDELISLYQGADVFVFPSLYEGFGLPVLEAMVAGVPVIAARKASIPEVGGDCVVYFDSFSEEDFPRKLLEVIGWGVEKRRIWCAQAKQRAKGFVWGKTADATVSVLRSVVSLRKKGIFPSEK